MPAAGSAPGKGQQDAKGKGKGKNKGWNTWRPAAAETAPAAAAPSGAQPTEQSKAEQLKQQLMNSGLRRDVEAQQALVGAAAGGGELQQKAEELKSKLMNSELVMKTRGETAAAPGVPPSPRVSLRAAPSASSVEDFDAPQAGPPKKAAPKLGQGGRTAAKATTAVTPTGGAQSSEVVIVEDMTNFDEKMAARAGRFAKPQGEVAATAPLARTNSGLGSSAASTQPGAADATSAPPGQWSTPSPQGAASGNVRPLPPGMLGAAARPAAPALGGGAAQIPPRPPAPGPTHPPQRPVGAPAPGSAPPPPRPQQPSPRPPAAGASSAGGPGAMQPPLRPAHPAPAPRHPAPPGPEKAGKRPLSPTQASRKKYPRLSEGEAIAWEAEYRRIRAWADAQQPQHRRNAGSVKYCPDEANRIDQWLRSATPPHESVR